MEGGGEGVVAVVRWLSDEGLAVGLLRSPQPWRRVGRALREPGGRPPARRARFEPRASQTFPERELKPVRPEPYASTYQVTHCGVDAGSPAHWHTEFPPQRQKPSPALGNFEVGRRSRSPAHSDVYNCRVEKDTACQFRQHYDRDVEAFVSSLRKYPSVAERPSADRLERLRKNSQTRSPKESPPPSKKRRHSWDRPQPFAPLSLYASICKECKDRRHHRNPRLATEPTDPKPKTYGPEKYPLPGPMSITAFDYLNSGKSSPRTPEKKVEIRQCKNAFRDAHREKRPVAAYPICPILKSRFEKHMKQYHPTTSKAPQVEFANLDTCSKCLLKRPCPCETSKRMRRLVEKEEQGKRLLEDTIFLWLKDIPIYPNENPHDKFIRDAIVKKLAETLSGMSDSEFAIEGKEEIEKALNKMPMWYPSDHREREHFKNMITDSLIEKIKRIKDMKSFNQAVEEFFDELKFDTEINKKQVLGNIITELNNIALNRPEDDSTYRDLLKMKAFELLDSLPVKTFGNKYEYLNELSDELADILVNPHLDQETKQTIKEIIRDILDHTHVHIKNREKVEESLNKLVADIAIKGVDQDKAQSLIKCLLQGNIPDDKIEAITIRVLELADEVKPIHAKLGQETKQMIKKNVRDMLDMSGVQIKNRVKVEEELHRIVHDVAATGMDEEEAAFLIKSVLKGKVAEHQQDDIINQMLELANQIKPKQVQSLDKETKEMIKGDIHDILDLSGVQIKDQENIEKTLHTIVHDLATKGMDEAKAEAMIKSLLKGKVSEDKHENIMNQILELARQVKPIPAQPLDKETKQMIKDDISDILDIPGAKIKDKEKLEKSLHTIVQDIATKGLDEDKAEAMIKSLLKGKVSEDKHVDIMNQILELANQVKPAPAQPLDKETKQMIKGDISDILDIPGAKIKDKEKLEKALHTIVQEIATKGLDEDKAEAMIKSLLKGKVSEDKHDGIMNQILELANQVKPTLAQPLDKETKQMIKGDISDILDIPGAKVKDKEKLEKALHTIVQDIATKGLDEDKAEAMIKSLLKGKVSEDKHDGIMNQILELANQVKPALAQPLDKETKQMIKGDISDILDIPGAEIKDKEKLEKALHTIVQDIATKGLDEDKAEAMIKSLLKGKVSEAQQDDITNQMLELANQVKPTPAQPLDKETKQTIKDDIRDVLDLSGAKVKDRQKIEKKLNTIVHDIATKGLDEDKAEAMIKSLLKGKVSEDKYGDIMNQILELARQVKPIPAQPLDKETKQMIKGDISDILNIPGAKIKDKEKLEKTLHTIVHDIATKTLDEDKAEAMIRSLLKGKVSEDKHDDIMNQILELANQVKPNAPPPLDKETKQMVKGDIHDILGVSGAKIKDKEKLEKSLNTIVHDLATKGLDEDKAEAMIKSLLKGKVSEDQQDDITNQILELANQVKPTPAQPLDKETKQTIKDDIRDVLDLSGAKVKDRQKIEKVLNTIVHDIATKGLDEDKAEAMIKSVLKGKVSKDQQDDIADQILSLANHVKPSHAQPIDKETKRIIEKDVGNILDLSKSYIKNRSQVEESLRNVITSMLSKNIGKDKAKSRLKVILKGKVSDNDVEDISNKFLELADKMKAKQTTNDPKLQETLKNDISDILDDTDISVRNRSKIEESLRDILSDLVMRGIDKDKAQDHINNTLKGNVSDSQAKEISKKILALAEQRSPSFSQDSKLKKQPLASSTQNEEKIYYDQVYERTRDWLKNIGIHLKDEQMDQVAEAIANETLDRQKYLQLNPGVKISDNKESEILKEQIFKALNKLVDKKLVQSIMTNVEDLMQSLKEIPSLQVSRDSSRGLIQDSVEFVQENLEGALLKWLRGSPIYQSRYPRNMQSQEQMMSKLAKALAAVLNSQAMTRPRAKRDEALLKEITKHLEGLPLEPQFKSKDYIQKLGGHLLDYLKSLQLFQDISARGSLKESQRTNTSFMPTTNHLNDIVNDWCEAIPLPNTDESFRIQQDLANNIILKIGEMNMNQDIFNDDSLYEDILQDFVDQQANALEISQYLTEDYKRVLIDQIKQVKQKVQNDLVGRAYKQQLRDTMSNALPSMACPTIEDLASFELIKENLADAFINLNYSGEDEAIRAKFKRRIMDEVNKYVNDYLRRCPAPPVNARRLNEELYKALIDVPVPTDESMRSEVETVRMKDVINDWLKTIPMNKQSKAELLRTNKIITLMAQKLQELENEFHPDFEDIAVEEIVTYLKKLPLKNKSNFNEMAKKLVDKIKNTADSRSFVEGTRSNLADDCLCIDLPATHVPLLARASNNLSCSSFIPPCGLSKEDQELLQRIRERSLLCETGTQSRNRKDAAVNPPPLDHGSQTEMPYQGKCCQHADKPEPVCPKFVSQKTKRVPLCTRPFTSTGSQANVCPQVDVKEYHWGPISGSVEFGTQTPVQESGRICIHSSPVNPEGICRSRERIVTRRPVKPCSQLETSNCRRTPRKQFTSACPNEYFTRAKPHNCLRTRPAPERDYLRSQCRRVPANRARRKSSCQLCHDATGMCPGCLPMHVCPYPTCLYFK